MKKLSPAVLIIMQTLAAMGAGCYIILTHIMIKYPNGGKIVADLFEMQNPPTLVVGMMVTICCLGTLVITIGNCTDMKWKEKSKDEKDSASKSVS